MEFIEGKEHIPDFALHYNMIKASIQAPDEKGHAEVSGTSKKGKNYNYSCTYTTLASIDKAIVDAINENLDDKKHPIFGYFFDIDNGKEGVSVSTILVDSTGCMAKTNQVWFKNFNIGDTQSTASLITYAKRYSLAGAFGIASEKDDDAQNAQPVEVKKLNDKQLQEFRVSYYGSPDTLGNVWNMYVNDHDADAHNWLLGNHPPQEAFAIKQLSDKLKAQRTKEEAREQRAKKAEQDSKVAAAAKKIQAASKTKSDDEVIKELVDGKSEKTKEDPFKDQKQETKVTSQQQDLFKDITGE